MKTLERAAVLAAAALFLVAGSARAEGPVTECLAHLKAVFLKSIRGQWIQIWTGDDEIDLLNSKAPFFTLTNKGNIPPGQYINIRFRFGEKFVVTGSDGPYSTRAGGESVIGGSASTNERLPGEILLYKETKPTFSKTEPGPMTVRFDFDYQDRDDYIEITPRREFQAPFAITSKSQIRASLGFDFSSSIQFVIAGSLAAGIPTDRAVIFTFPKRVLEMVLRVDFKSRYVKGNDIVVEF